ncbi:MAG TPA: MATE family efflux transporter [Polyangiaceae bacterium]|jgi:putative MATE family efflux protein
MADGGSRILSGPVRLEVLRFGLPLSFGMGIQTAFNLVDAYVISKLDAGVAGPALGAIGICDQLAALGTIVSYGISVASATLLSRRAGAKDDQGVKRVAFQSMLIVAALSALIGAAGAFGAGFLIHDVVGAKGRVAELAVPYLRAMLGGSFTIFFLLHLTSVQRALGSSKTPIALLLLSNLLNFLLAVVLVYGPGRAPPVFAWAPAIARACHAPRLGLMGAAWATLLARAIVLVPLVAILVARFDLFPKAVRKVESRLIREILHLGWPSSAQLVLRLLAMLLTHSVVARAFTTAQDQSATTALGIVFRLETMALFVGLGWGGAAQTFVGQNLGANKRARAKLSGWYASLYNALMMGALAAGYIIWGRPLVALFDSDPAVVTPALSYLHWVGLSYVGLGIGVVLGSAVQGAGNTLRAFLLDAAVVLGLQLPASLLVLAASHASYVAIWQVVALTYVAFALVHVANYRWGRFLGVARGH